MNTIEVIFFVVVGIVLFCICAFVEEGEYMCPCTIVISVILTIMLVLGRGDNPDSMLMFNYCIIALTIAQFLLSLFLSVTATAHLSFLSVILLSVAIYLKLSVPSVILLPAAILLVIIDFSVIRSENKERRVLAQFQGGSKYETESYTPGYTEISITKNAYGSGYSGTATRVSARGKTYTHYEYKFLLPSGKELVFKKPPLFSPNDEGKYGLLIYSGRIKLNQDYNFIVSEDQEKAKAEFEALKTNKS